MPAVPIIRRMAELIVAGVLTWLLVCTWWGTTFILRPGRRERVVGAALLAVGLIPGLLALWLGSGGFE